MTAELARLERTIQLQPTLELDARTALAKQDKILDEELERVEKDAYLSRRPAIGQGVRLTEADYRTIGRQLISRY